MAAQYSLPYAVATTLLLDPQDPRSFSPEVMERPDVLQVMDRVKARAAPEFDKLLPEKYPGGVRFTLRNGRSAERTRLDSVGTPERPVDREGIVCKFRSLTAGILDPARQDAIVEAAFALEQPNGVSQLMDLVRQPVAMPD
jgi:2-methylcitrate dehydratase PrpD